LILATATLVAHREPISARKVLELAEATAAAGFDGVVLWTDHVIWASREGVSGAAVAAHHRQLGLSIPAVEVALDWSDDGVLDVANEVGARDVVTATLTAEASFDQLVVRLRRLADSAAERGLRISLEFLPWSAIPDLSTAVRLIEAADRENVGVVLDVWHWYTQPGGSAAGRRALAELAPDRIHQVQLNDLPPGLGADYREVGRTRRLLPGDGVADIVGLCSAVAARGAEPLLTVEVMNHALAAQGPSEMARQAFGASRAVKGRCGTGSAANGS
jgi:sugar phosphate isomerase/epimerase